MNMHAIFSNVISKHGMSPDPAKVKELMDMLPPKIKRELQSFLDAVKYLSKVSSMTAKGCKPLWRLTFVKAEKIWDRAYQDIYERAKITTKRRPMHEILWHQEVTILGNWHNRSRPGHFTTVGRKEPKLQTLQNISQHNILAHHVC